MPWGQYWGMERSLANGLAARVVIFGFVILLIYWVLPDAGISEFKKMNAAMQNARSWRMHTVVDEPTKNIDTLTEVYCPSSVHTVNKSTIEQGGEKHEASSESIWIEGTSYTRKDNSWMLSHELRRDTSLCSWGPRGTDALLGQMDVIAKIGKIRKGDKREANGFACRDWIASAPAPAGWRDIFGVCVDSDHLPREVFTPDRSEVITYSDWNLPIKIEAPPSDEIIKSWK
jgi:hypothetical protein